MVRHHVIYISGLGDLYDGPRRFFLKFWQMYGVKTELVAMQWTNDESYEDKFMRVKQAIETAQASGRRVSLVGESAGASMMFNVAADEPELYGIVSLCGVNTSKTPVATSILHKKPAFARAIKTLDDAREKVMITKADHVTAITARRDQSVPVSTNQIVGAQHIKVFSVGHLTTIFLCLTVYNFIVVRAIKRS